MGDDRTVRHGKRIFYDAAPVVVGVHGYNSNGQYIKELQPYFTSRGFNYHNYIYGKRWIGPIGNLIINRFRTRDVSSGLVTAVSWLEANVILVGHSHGFYLSWIAHQHCSNVVGVIGVNGCLQRGTGFNQHVFRINYYCPTDWVLKVGARLRPFSMWGDFGAVQNVSAENINLAAFGVSGHSDVFNPDILKVVGPNIAKEAAHHYKQITGRGVK